MTSEEQTILAALDAAVRRPRASAALEPLVESALRKLKDDPDALLAWEPIPLEAYGAELPPGILSSWVFALRADGASGAERHPNSHQRMVSYRGAGDFQVWVDEQWQSNLLVSDHAAPLEQRWISIPVNVWHQAVVPTGEHWVVVSFHTVRHEDLIEERPDPADQSLTRRRHYVE